MEGLIMKMSRRGMTLIELLVVIAIIGLLVGLILPAVQMAREAGRRAACLNNLKQIGLALHMYADRNGVFPPGYISRVVLPSREDGGPGWAWAAMLLPDVEQGSLNQQVNFTAALNSPAADSVRTVSLATFVCPSDSEFEPTIEIPAISDDSVICTMAASSYVGCIGTVRPTCRICRDSFDGMFGRNRAVSFAEVCDGTSNTMAIGERAFKWSSPALWGVIPGSELVDRLIVGRLAAGPGYVLGTTFKDGFNLEEIVDDPREDHSLAETFGSMHPGGANFAFCDGGVRFIKDSIDPAVMNAISTRCGTPYGGETIHSNPLD
jgi:prepilin-type N-terminal cleavage/methylation domain-containing protein/prepilin-type processing-associated H-X9-DG protein